ncbi:reverse transcriptase domain-containing protein [Tanacetum coccineum]|uniref:Reverse transcriptase domain-containing protein n=1 Tax=Tanacetum coccineum TaxID=301880 RepID=A0ABQ5CZZ7_9ASTR
MLNMYYNLLISQHQLLRIKHYQVASLPLDARIQIECIANQVAARKLLQKLGNAFATLSIFLIRVDDVCCISNRTTSEHVGRIRCKWYIFDGDEFESILKYLNVLRDGEEGENQLSLCVLAMKAALDLGSDGEAEKDLKDSVGCQVPETINVVSCDSYTVNDDVTSKRQREHRSDYGLDVEPEPNLPLQEIIILDPNDHPMWESAKTVAPTPNSAIVQIDVDDNFVINSTHLKMIWENKFDGYLRVDPHDHIREFLAICNMFKYCETQSEAVKLLIFPFSLCDEAKNWFNELNEESITSWEQIRRVFINRFFPPLLFNRILLEIRNFSQNVCENLTEAWLRLKSMLRKCHGHGLTKGAIIQVFYHGLDESTQRILDITAGGIFLYKSPNQDFQFIEDRVLFEHYWPIKSKHH